MSAKANAEYCFNWLDEQLPNVEAKRFYAQDMAMLAATETVIRCMVEQGVSRTELAERIGKSKGLVSQVLSGSRNMTLKTLGDLLWGLGLEVKDVVVRPLGESKVVSAHVDEWLDADCTVSAQALASTTKEFEVQADPDLVAA